MIRRAVYPGSFNPIHNGHLDIILRAARVFDELIVAVYENPAKPELFSIEERVDLVWKCVRDSQIANVEVASFSGLAVNYVKSVNAFAIVRGLRVFSDFEFEFRMALANHRLAPEIEVVNFIASEETIHISSSTVREIASLNGDVSSFVPSHVEQALVKSFAG
jgi:pantetheine-phosphate adenylyltransferase